MSEYKQLMPNRLAKLIEEQLNSNDLGLKFKVFYYIAALDRNFELTEDKKLESFIPVYLGNIDGRYRPIRMEISDNQVPIQILFPSDKKDEIYTCFLQMRQRLLGNVLKDNGLNFVFNFSVPTMNRLNSPDLTVISQTETRFQTMQENMSIMDFNLYFVAAEATNTVFGNQVEYYFVYLDDEGNPCKDEEGNEIQERIYQVDSAFSNTLNIKAAQCLGEKTTEIIGESNSISRVLTFYDSADSAMCNHLLYLAETGKIQNYKIRIIKKYCDENGVIRVDNFPGMKQNENLVIKENYLIQSLVYSGAPGDLSTITIIFSKAAE